MRIAIVICSLLFPLIGFAQANFWHTLAEVHFSREKNAEGFEVERPVFSKHLKSYQGKPVQLKGYIIPLSEVNRPGLFMLSAVPFNLCYFCGAAGPETVIEVEMKTPIKFSTRPVVVEGRLKLNDRDPDHHMYILESAKAVSLK